MVAAVKHRFDPDGGSCDVVGDTRGFARHIGLETENDNQT
jgi:hypothetical protein